VFTIPFDVTITENGKVTVHNNDVIEHTISHTGTVGTEKGGTFYKVIPISNSRTLEFPITGSSTYPSGVYSFEDTVTGKVGTITIEKWGGSEQVIQDTTITGVTQGIVEEVGVQENVVVVVKHDDNTQTVITTSTPIEVNSVDQYTMTSLHSELVYTNNELTKALESVGLLQNELDSSLSTITTQQQKIISLEKNVESTSTLSKDQVLRLESTVTVLETQVNTLEAEKIVISKERDDWKKLSDQWYAVAMEQVRVMIEVLGL
jgi:flagellin-like hook-associated protein FlgL